MARRGRAQEEEDVELNMTPMLDVVFILLIFFIVTAVFVKEPGVDITRPNTVLLEKQNPTILVAVTSADEIWINKELVDPRGVRTVVQDLKDENPKAEAVIQGDESAKSGIILDVMEVMQELQIPVYISSEEG